MRNRIVAILDILSFTMLCIGVGIGVFLLRGMYVDLYKADAEKTKTIFQLEQRIKKLEKKYESEYPDGDFLVTPGSALAKRGKTKLLED